MRKSIIRTIISDPPKFSLARGHIACIIGLALSLSPHVSERSLFATADEPVKPRVLFVGDSISGSLNEAYVGYSHHIEAAVPEWEVSRRSVSTSERLLSLLRSEPESFRGFDVIYLNAGLHSLRRDRFEDLQTYEDNLSAAMALLAEIENTRVIWRTTSPIKEHASGGRDGRKMPVYNGVSVRLAHEHGLRVDDLHAYLLPYLAEDDARGGKYMVSDGTHWTTEAQRTIIAPHVIEVIRAQID